MCPMQVLQATPKYIFYEVSLPHCSDSRHFLEVIRNQVFSQSLAQFLFTFSPQSLEFFLCGCQ